MLRVSAIYLFDSWLTESSAVMNVDKNFTTEQMDTLAERLLEELRDTGAHYPLRAVWARKKE